MVYSLTDQRPPRSRPVRGISGECVVSKLLATVTIRTKVILGFSAVLLCTLGLGLFAMQRLAQVNAASSDIANNWLPSTYLLGDVSMSYERLRSRQAQLLLAEGAGVQKQ